MSVSPIRIVRERRTPAANYVCGCGFWRRRYGDNWETKFRQKYEVQMIANDTHFYVGTVHQYPKAWIIVACSIRQ